MWVAGHQRVPRPPAPAAAAATAGRQRPAAHPARPRRCRAAAAGVGALEQLDVDCAVVGSGIIGLLVARQLLLADETIRVALLDAKRPCAGATGAGQGYIWMAHRDPASPGWALARHSKALWERLAGGAQGGGSPALQAALEWQPNGSLLLGTTDAEVAALQARAAMLQQQGVPGVVLLSPRELGMLEPALALPPGARGLLVKSDAQINGKATAFGLLDECQRLAAAGRGGGSRLVVALQEGVQHVAALGAQGGVELTTSRRRVRARRGVVVAAGVWSGQLLADATGDPAWRQLLQPRRGHLLEVAPPPGMPPLHTGMMEQSYTQHYSISAGGGGGGGGHDSSSDAVDITFTATTSASGSLLIGSSREFSGYEATPNAAIIAAIMQRAATFLPALAAISSSGLADTTRVGLRPYAVGGLPAVGPVPLLPGVVVAAGHEGSGLCLGPATAELVAHHLALSAEGGRGPDGDLLRAAEELLPEARLRAAVAAQ